MFLLLRYSFLFVVLFLCSSTTVFAQNFISGLVITSAGDTLRGHIDFNLWPTTPNKISFRHNKTVTKYSPEELQEFQIMRKDGYLETYHTKTAAIDVSDQHFNDYTESPEAKMETKTLFFKLLLSGPLNLYYHKDKSQTVHYFIEKASGEIEALEYRKYRKKVGDDWQIATSMRYKNQLMIMTNDCNKKMDASRIKYSGKKITAYLVQYFACIGESATYTFQQEQQRPSIYVLAGGGITRTKNWSTSQLQSTSKAKTPTFGLGAGFDFPFSKRFSLYNELFINNYAFNDSLLVFENEEFYSKGYADFKSINAKVKTHFRYHLLFEPSQLIFSVGPSFGFSTQSGNSLYIRKFYSTYEEVPRKASGIMQSYGITLNVGYHYKQFGVELKLETAASSSSSLETNTSWRSIELVATYRLNKHTVRMKK